MSEKCDGHHAWQSDDKPVSHGPRTTSTSTIESTTSTLAQSGGEQSSQVQDGEGPESATSGQEARDPELGLTRTTTSEAPYSVFTTRQKRFIIAMTAFGSFFSPISGNIYFPALNVLAEDLHVSNSLINLTLTSYMIFQGIAPTFMGDLADSAGRRPAYLVSFTIYVFANVGLALQNDYAALFVLRCLQSAGSSATVALASGIAGDISTAAERGSYQSYASMGGQLGPVLGPVLGGVLVQFLGWPSIFWFLLISSLTFLVPFALFFPETSRNVVGNGSIPAQSWNLPMVSYLKICWRRKIRRKTNDNLSITHHHRSPSSIHSQTSRFSLRHRQQSTTQRKLRFPNPLASIRVLRDPSTLLLLTYNALIFTCFYFILATIPPQYKKIYHFNTLKIGLCYIPFGIGSCTAATLNGRLLDWNFRRTSHLLGITVNRKRSSSLANFPIERARLQISLPSLHLLLAVLLIYGWILEIRGPLPATLVLLFILGYTVTATFYTNQTLLVDFHPTQPSTATAANNLLRCLWGAAGLAVVDPMIDKMGVGGMFSFLVAVLFIASPAYWVLFFWGMRLRRRALEKKNQDQDNNNNNRKQSPKKEKEMKYGISEPAQHRPSSSSASREKPNHEVKAEMKPPLAVEEEQKPAIALGGLPESAGLAEVEKEIERGIKEEG